MQIGILPMNDVHVINVPGLDRDAISKIAETADEKALAVAEDNPGAATVIRKVREWIAAAGPVSAVTLEFFLDRCKLHGYVGSRLWYEYKNVHGGDTEKLVSSVCTVA